jgi:2-phosphoglycerate kinase
MIIYELGEPSLWFDTMKMVDAIKLQRQKERTKDALIEQERIHTAIDLKRKKDREESQRRRNRDQLLEIINKVVIWTIAILIGGATTIGLFYYMLGKASALVIRNLGV